MGRQGDPHHLKSSYCCFLRLEFRIIPVICVKSNHYLVCRVESSFWVDLDMFRDLGEVVKLSGDIIRVNGRI
jgi:hypothetical protein